MTDNEIIKALEWCEHFENNIVFKGSGDEKCVQALQMMVVIKHALRNYNRQQAEIERLQKQPVADAEEVRHAKWLPQIVLGARVWDCSSCKTIGSPRWKRCPVCEAKMERVMVNER